MGPASRRPARPVDEDLFVIGRDGKGLRQLTNDSHNDRAPRWSPDGRTILCSLQQPGAPFVMNLALPWTQQTPQSLPSTGISDGMIITSWSADGQKLIGMRGGIFTYSFATQRYEQLTDFGGMPAWLNDNRHAFLW
ncbi:MAG TPA: hypothetical protein VGB07_06415 [Blastocatellia bacterium]